MLFRSSFAPITGIVRSVDTTATRQLLHRSLATPYGGNLPAVVDKKGNLTVQDPIYRVLIDPTDQGETVKQVVRGSVRIQIEWEILAQNFVSKAISLIVRDGSRKTIDLSCKT